MNPAYIKAATVRAVKTFAQTAAAAIGVNAIGLLDVDWVGVASTSALAATLSLLTSIAGLPEVDIAGLPEVTAAVKLETEADAQSRYNDRNLEPYVREFTACEGCPGDCDGCPNE